MYRWKKNCRLYSLKKLYLLRRYKHCTKNEVFHQGFLSVNVTKSGNSCWWERNVAGPSPKDMQSHQYTLPHIAFTNGLCLAGRQKYAYCLLVFLLCRKWKKENVNIFQNFVRCRQSPYIIKRSATRKMFWNAPKNCVVKIDWIYISVILSFLVSVVFLFTISEVKFDE